MAKKVYTIDVNNKNLKVSAKTSETKVENVNKIKSTKTASVSKKTTVSKQVTPVLKSQNENKNSETVKVADNTKFDSEVSQVIRVARIGSLFGCDKRMIIAQ